MSLEEASRTLWWSVQATHGEGGVWRWGPQRRSEPTHVTLGRSYSQEASALLHMMAFLMGHCKQVQTNKKLNPWKWKVKNLARKARRSQPCPGWEGVCTGTGPTSTVCWWAHFVKDISRGISQVLFKKQRKKEKKKLFKDIFCAGLVRWGSLRGPIGTGAPGPPRGCAGGNPGARQPGLCLHRNWAGQGKPLETLGSVKVSGFSFPHTLCILLHPYFKNIQIHSTEYTRMCSRCLKISLASGKWGWARWVDVYAVPCLQQCWGWPAPQRECWGHCPERHPQTSLISANERNTY